ncbi:MAG: hypothetical protein AAF614_20240 [Chloroflexota bacterium]
MNTLAQIEKNIDLLTLDEQLWLIERLVQRVRKSNLHQQSEVGNDLAAMANDPEIQNELRSIEAEFAYAEADGLDIV